MFDVKFVYARQNKRSIYSSLIGKLSFESWTFWGNKWEEHGDKSRLRNAPKHVCKSVGNLVIHSRPNSIFNRWHAEHRPNIIQQELHVAPPAFFWMQWQNYWSDTVRSKNAEAVNCVATVLPITGVERLLRKLMLMKSLRIQVWNNCVV